MQSYRCSEGRGVQRLLFGAGGELDVVGEPCLCSISLCGSSVDTE